MPKGDRDITVVRKPRRDKLSSGDETPETIGEIKAVSILPRRTFEVDRGWVTIEGYTIWILPTSQGYTDGMIKASDFIEIDGVEWQVDGQPGRYTKKGSVYTELQVKKVGSA